MLSIDLFLRTKTYHKFTPNKDTKMTNPGRIVGILLWPLMLAIFLGSFIVAFVRHNKRPPHTQNKKRKKK